METCERFGTLGHSCIEGVDAFDSKFQFLMTAMKKKAYDFLDYRKLEFDSDLDEFKETVIDIEVSPF